LKLKLKQLLTFFSK